MNSSLDSSAHLDTNNVLASSWYMVVLCMVAYVFSFIDRQILALLVEHIRADFDLNDTQFSLIHGFSFALFYALMGLPIARMADTRSRPAIIAIGVAVWSAATMVCGLAKNFWHLFFARMGVGVGEAALSPAAYSMITDAFPKSRLGLALGIYSMGSFFGAGIAFMVGGVAIEWVVSSIGTITIPVIGEIKPWQMTFFIVGAPGLLLAALFQLTVRDPARKGVEEGHSGYSLAEVGAYMRLNWQTFLSLNLGFGLLSMVLFALLSWSPAFLLRNFELATREVGLYLGSIVLVCNALGVLASGCLTDFWSRRGHTDAAMKSGMTGGIGALLPALAFPFMPGLDSTIAVLAVAFFFASFPLATSAAALQIAAPNRMRAQVTAVFFLFLNLFGITGGATLVALCTDYLFREENLVGYSMALVAGIGAVLAVVVTACGCKYYRATARQVSNVPPMNRTPLAEAGMT
ncbi:spinster family MFS transporter [Parahaliea mediterranea]|uniref:spinster family MFS transporter n=1 Tax=Parahaliea mediterranea TaxID=651086 RepID=UPI0019D4A210|nr:MFS transporter [Parahaliea mediterranea]